MDSWEAIKKCVGPLSELFAKPLRLCKSSIDRWMRPTDDYTSTGSLNPVDRVEELIHTSLKLQKDYPKLQPFAPLEYLEHQFKRVAIELPTIDECDEPKELISKTLPALKEAGEFISVLTASIESGDIDRDELKQINKDGWEAIEAILVSMKISSLNCKANRGRR